MADPRPDANEQGVLEFLISTRNRTPEASRFKNSQNRDGILLLRHFRKPLASLSIFYLENIGRFLSKFMLQTQTQ